MLRSNIIILHNSNLEESTSHSLLTCILVTLFAIYVQEKQAAILLDKACYTSQHVRLFHVIYCTASVKTLHSLFT